MHVIPIEEQEQSELLNKQFKSLVRLLPATRLLSSFRRQLRWTVLILFLLHLYICFFPVTIVVLITPPFGLMAKIMDVAHLYI